MPLRLALRCLLPVAVIAVVSVFVWSTFRPEARFHFPTDLDGYRLHCIFEAVYLSDTDADVLVFGTSRTNAAFNPSLLGKKLSDRSGHSVNVASLSTAGANPELSYQYLQEYLSRHRPPKLIIFEVEQVRDSPSVVPYVNRHFSMTAKPDLYLDTLVHLDNPTAVNRLADVSRLMIDHLDKALSKVLSPWHTLTLDPENLTCRHGARTSAAMRPNVPSSVGVRQAVIGALARGKASAERLMAGKGNDSALKASKRVSKKSAGKTTTNPAMAARRQRALRVMAEATRARESSWEELPAWDWGYASPKADRYLLYYRRFVDWAAGNDARIVFLRLPGYLEPPSTPGQIAEFEALVGAPVLVPDLPILRELYPDYRDVNHMGAVSQPLMMGWLADRLAEQMTLPEVFAQRAAPASQ